MPTKKRITRKKPTMKKRPDPTPDIATAVIDQSHIRRIQFEAQRHVSRMAMPDEHDSAMGGITMRQFQDEACRRMILEVQAKVASRKFDSKTVRYPDGVWQFMKHNISKSQWMWMKWLRSWVAKHPVRYVEVTMEANAYNPTIAIPDHDTFVEICTQARYRQVGAYD